MWARGIHYLNPLSFTWNFPLNYIVYFTPNLKLWWSQMNIKSPLFGQEEQESSLWLWCSSRTHCPWHWWAERAVNLVARSMVPWPGHLYPRLLRMACNSQRTHLTSPITHSTRYCSLKTKWTSLEEYFFLLQCRVSPLIPVILHMVNDWDYNKIA